MDKKIIDYITSNNVLTMATCIENIPYCANCFYVFENRTNTLVFLSDDETRHISEALANDKVAGTINIEVTNVAKIKGLQFTGKFVNPTTEQQKLFYQAYYDKFPFAKAKPSLVWGIELETIKMTDNTLGFGKKIKWSKY